ncbi:hypothetical protein BT63DRAFT_1844 [Microthyrium microscopicum]|uniref:Uncharacterized protein n=1 Tax=Microthyrium microscopicum TaxID=703497 RepID=A0A6A6UQR4_9PEZI|nr:hypothetical protein BT63DRAFT_1844 [Microthyrium microscopicum]
MYSFPYKPGKAFSQATARHKGFDDPDDEEPKLTEIMKKGYQIKPIGKDDAQIYRIMSTEKGMRRNFRGDFDYAEASPLFILINMLFYAMGRYYGIKMPGASSVFPQVERYLHFVATDVSILLSDRSTHQNTGRYSRLWTVEHFIIQTLHRLRAFVWHQSAISHQRNTFVDFWATGSRTATFDIQACYIIELFQSIAEDHDHVASSRRNPSLDLFFFRSLPIIPNAISPTKYGQLFKKLNDACWTQFKSWNPAEPNENWPFSLTFRHETVQLEQCIAGRGDSPILAHLSCSQSCNKVYLVRSVSTLGDHDMFRENAIPSRKDH